jgi:hypothetical protein
VFTGLAKGDLNLNTLGATIRYEVYQLTRSVGHDYDKLIGSIAGVLAEEITASDQFQASSPRSASRETALCERRDKLPVVIIVIMPTFGQSIRSRLP